MVDTVHTIVLIMLSALWFVMVFQWTYMMRLILTGKNVNISLKLKLLMGYYIHYTMLVDHEENRGLPTDVKLSLQIEKIV